MTLIDIVRSLPLHRDELMRAAGYRARPGRLYPVASSLGLVGLGIALGAGMALLYAPEAGANLRKRLVERFDGVVHLNARQAATPAQETAH